MTVFIGFDSAWTDNKQNPGAICAVSTSPDGNKLLLAPTLATFDQASDHIARLELDVEQTIVAIDQPTIVKNPTGMRPVERLAASVISYMGGGVQPANRNKIGMFCDQGPIWKFLKSLNAIEDPLAARTATSGKFVMEVFPALALATFAPNSYSRLGALKYNPTNKKRFSSAAWNDVANLAADLARNFDIEPLASWLDEAASIQNPKKADQDRLDSALCVLIALQWKLGPAEESILIGDLESGYMVTPASLAVRDLLKSKARENGVRIDGMLA